MKPGATAARRLECTPRPEQGGLSLKIVDVTTHVLLDPDYDRTATSSAQDTIVVEITTDEGLVGIGETDVNAWVARARRIAL
jgi:L-alanine-DL-glutamate epimerase-like enolase superfamily enzyme